MNAEQAKKLRTPFKPEQIGKLPRAANKAAKEANRKGNCEVCGKYHVLPAIHLDYVSHAVITDFLCREDPDWTWEPMAVDEHGAPVISNGGLWIKLTVFGKTLPGYGDAEGGRGIKEMIGDALRNGAMRFGIGLDLWIKEDLHSEDHGETAAKAGAVQPAPAPSSDPAGEKEAELFALVDQLGALDATKESCEKHRAQWSDDRSKYLDWLDRCIKAAERNLREKPNEDSQFAAKAAEAQAKKAAA